MQTLSLKLPIFDFQKVLMIVAAASMFFLLLLSPATAQSCSTGFDPNDPIGSGANCAKGSGTATDLFGQDGLFKKVSNILIFLVGAVSVIMLIIGGFRYVVSGGDSSGVESAKNTILYAIVGIVVAFLSYAAVNFVINGLSNTTTTGSP